MPLQSFITPLIALQFVAFGWRINREVVMEGKGERTWLPASDWLNIVSLIAVTWCCMLRPLYTQDFGRLSKSVLAVSYVLIALHPVSQAAHYRLFSPKGRSIYEKGAPWITDQEIASLLITLGAALLTGWIIWHAV
jgi:hypothetical protein